ncbi:hypothetical protein D3C86_1382890 [compost metagenome]
MLVDQLGQALLGRQRHAAAQRVVHRGHGDDGRQALLLQQQLQRVQRQAVLRVGGDLQHLEAEAGQERVEVEVARRLHAHGVAGAGHRAQRQLQRLHGAVGEQDVVGRQGHAEQRGAPGDLLAQAQRARRQGVATDQLGLAAQQAGGQPRQLGARIERLAARAGQRQVDMVGTLLALQHHRHQVVHRPRRAHPGRPLAQRPLQRWQAAAHVVAGLWARLYQAAILEQAVGSGDGVEAQLMLGGTGPHRRQADAGRQTAAVDGRGQFVGQQAVADGCIHGGSPVTAGWTCDGDS